MIHPDQWAKNIDKELEQQKELELRYQDALVVKQKLIAAHAPRLWEELLGAVCECCEAYNKNKSKIVLVFSQLGVHDFLVRRDGFPATIEGHYDYATRFIRIVAEDGTTSEVFEPHVITSKDGMVVLVAQGDGLPRTAPDIAQTILGRFLKGF